MKYLNLIHMTIIKSPAHTGSVRLFAMMYLLDALPPPTGNYKSYDKDAKKFINSVMKHPSLLAYGQCL